MELFNYFKNRTVQTVVVLLVFVMYSQQMSVELLRVFYTCSVLIKDVLVAALPIMVCFFIAASLAKFEKKAPLFIVLLLTFEACSNLTSVWYAYFAGLEITNFVASVHQVEKDLTNLTPYYNLSALHPGWWTVGKGTASGLILGILCAWPSFSRLRKVVNQCKSMLEFTLTKIFSRLIPVFVLGFVANIYAMDLLTKIFVEFVGIIGWVLCAIIFYILCLYLVAAKFNLAKAKNNLLNLLPAGFIALTSGCSISTMPFTIKGTEKNLTDPEFAQMVIPATTNIQQIGDCIINVLLCLVIIKSFGKPMPSLYQWLEFSFVFTLARFATAAVLGGAIFIILPIYVAYLGFSPEMIAIILAFNVILDPIVTASNVMANSALCNILENVWLKIGQSWQSRLASQA